MTDPPANEPAAAGVTRDPAAGKTHNLAVGLVLAAAFALAWAFVAGPFSEKDEISDEEHRANVAAVLGPPEPIEYVLSGSAGSVSVTYTNSSGDTQQNSSAQTNQTIELGSVPSGEFLYISVQNNSDHGRVACEIRKGDRVLAEAESSGAYVIATCDASAP